MFQSTRGRTMYAWRSWRGLAVAALAVGVATTSASGPLASASTPPGSAAEPAAAPSGDPIQIGALVTYSGPAGSLGQDQVTGLELAAEEINAAGGLLGRPVEIVLRDDEADPTKAAQGIRDLVDGEGVKFVYGPSLSSSVLAAVAVTTPAGVINFHSGAAEELSDATEHPYAFRTTSSTVTQANTFIEFAEGLGVTKIGMIAVNQAFGDAAIDGIETAVEGSGVELVGVERFDIGATDLVPQVQQIQGAGAEILVVVASGVGENVAAVRARNDLAWDVPIAGLASMGNPLAAEGVGGDGMANVFAGQLPITFTQPVSDEFGEWIERVRVELDQHPLTRDVQQVAAGYDALMLIAEAVEAVGELDTDLVKQYLEETDTLFGIQGPYAYDAERHEGLPLDGLTFADAGSFEDGLYSVIEND